MATSSSNQRHTITVCTDCRITGKPCRPGLELLAQLNESLAALKQPLDRDFSVSGTACMAGCTRPCTIAFQASGKATYLFGDILPDQNIEDLVAFAAVYAGLPDGLTREAERPRGLNGKTIARVPAAFLASEQLAERLQ
jgi:predicted metal-binding protein